MIPYTYLIGWSTLNKYYYGVRYAKNCCPDDLWVTYFTSSKHVKQFRKNNGEPDIKQVRRVFLNKEAAGEWEYKVLRRLSAVRRDDFLNKSDTKIHDRTGKLHSAETKFKMGMKRKGRTPFEGKLHSAETKLKMSNDRVGAGNSMFGKKHTTSSKKIMSEKRKMETWYCAKCDKRGVGNGNYQRWHFNCEENI